MTTIKEIQKQEGNENLSFMQAKCLKVHMENTDKYLSNAEIAQLMGSAVSSVKTFRAKLVKAGHSFEYETEIKKGNKIANRYKYVGRTFKGTNLVDTTMPMVDIDVLKSYSLRLSSNNTMQVLDSIVHFQASGSYWTYDDIIEHAGVSRKNVLSAIQSYKRCYGFKFHSRGNIKKRQYVVTEITGLAMDKVVHEKKEKVNTAALLNKVFG